MPVLESVRDGRIEDAIDGVIPQRVVQPATAEEAAAALAWAAQERLATVIRGAGTKLSWGRPPTRVDLVIGTASLNRHIVHRHGDLTATVEAGVELAALNRELARNGQWLPLDSAFDRATIGGMLAANDAGPIRHRYGTPRDLLIGITLALTDGRQVKAGGNVVKNVAGYDLGKLVCGSFGRLAAIVDATFKLMPLPATSASVVAEYADAAALAGAVAALMASQLEPEAFDVRVDSTATSGLAYRLLLRFASSRAATEAQVGAARTLVAGKATTLTGDGERDLWDEQRRAPWSGAGAVVRLGWMPARLEQVLTHVAYVQRTAAGALTFAGRAGTGAGFLCLDGETRVLKPAIEHLRSSTDVGNVVLVRGSADLKSQVDVWGTAADSASMSGALTQMFDPAGILNAGRGPI